MNQNSRGVLLNFRLKRLKVRPSKFKTTAQPTQKPQITTDLTWTVTVFENRHIKVMNENSKDECEITHPLKKTNAMLRGYRRVSRAAAKMFKTVISLWSPTVQWKTDSLHKMSIKTQFPLRRCRRNDMSTSALYSRKLIVSGFFFLVCVVEDLIAVLPLTFSPVVLVHSR